MNKLIITDFEQRKTALDQTRSFIVQAPAGSGKTTLLIQRYLKLLAHVNAPEEIIAITFTRKAAYEMRDRTIKALKTAVNNPSHADSHETTTQQLAQAVLKQAQIKNWYILQNPSRLRIQTIDALCNHLVKRTPVLTNLNIQPQILQGQDTKECYREAVRTILENLSDHKYVHYLENLLLHLDNDWELVEKLFMTMLASREQWLPHIIGLNNTEKLRQNMEATLQLIAQENLEYCIKYLPQELQQELCFLLKFSKDNHENPPAFLQQLSLADDFCDIKLNGWLGLAGFLLTKEFNWRKKVTKNHGFPTSLPGASKEDVAVLKTMKQQMEELLIKLCDYENFRASLENLLCSPPPHYNDQQWQIIEALLELLPLLAAQLKVVFNEKNVADYAEISMAAYRALGDEEIPSELALNLDYRLQHILVDEFQDISVAQYRLIEKLITTWQEDDGHTLFFVGDPMQSIYRFRNAEVGLFLRVQNEGIGMLKPQLLKLTTNFRSCKNIITWLNNNFSEIFPLVPTISLGGVPFSPSVAIKQDENSGIKIELLKNANYIDEATHVVETIQKIQHFNPEATIAILVNSRNHLQKIIPAMRDSGLNYQAYEYETLDKSTVVRDLYALTRALFHLADRIAWLAILRAPWCGLTLKDLHCLANGKAKIIWDNISNYQELDLSPDGKQRIYKFQKVIEPIIAQCGRISWHKLIKDAWLKLGGPATLEQEYELEHAQTYFSLISSINTFDLEIICNKLSDLYLAPSQTAKIQIMTIHKAKGLEFDHVIIPGIDRSTKSDEHALMLWFERPGLHHGSNLLLASIEASGNDLNPVYRYLQLVEQKKNYYEMGRLLYVALTRAKKSVHVIGCINYQDTTENFVDKISERALLKQLSSCFSKDWLIDISKNTIEPNHKSEATLPKLSRLADSWLSPIDLKKTADNSLPSWQFIDNQPAIIGTVIHFCLKQISIDSVITQFDREISIDCPIKSGNDDYIQKQRPYWQKLLQQFGCADVYHGLETITKAIQATLTDRRGQWILANHQDAESEMEITTVIDNICEHFVIDRTFIDDDNFRWIIDYKTSQPDTKNMDVFLAQELDKYLPQLTRYAKIMHDLDNTKTIKLGLYFPLCQGWIETDFSIST